MTSKTYDNEYDDNDNSDMKMDYLKEKDDDDVDNNDIQEELLQSLSLEEIVEVIHIVLSELNMQVS